MSLLKERGLVYSYTEKTPRTTGRRPAIYGLTVAGVRYLEAVRQCDAILRNADRSPAEES